MLSSFLSVSGVGQTAVCDLVSWPRGTIRYSPNGLGDQRPERGQVQERPPSLWFIFCQQYVVLVGAFGDSMPFSKVKRRGERVNLSATLKQARKAEAQTGSLRGQRRRKE